MIRSCLAAGALMMLTSVALQAGAGQYRPGLSPEESPIPARPIAGASSQPLLLADNRSALTRPVSAVRRRGEVVE